MPVTIRLSTASDLDRWARRRQRPRRRGIALLLVLIIISVGSLLTMRFLQTAADRSVMSQNLVDAKKAEYLAESGMAEACYWLARPELTGGAAWTGVAGRRLDSSLDCYDVTVTQKPADPTWYVVSSQGHFMGAAGERMARTVSADFRMYYGFADAVTAPQDLLVPASVRIVGNVFAFSSLDNRGRIDGSVWVGGSFANAGTVAGLTHLGCPARVIGTYPVSAPATYIYDSLVYVAEPILVETATNEAWNPTIANPMGVRFRSGNLRLDGTTTIDGTLIVSGNLTLSAGSTTTLTARPDFPGLVVGGHLVMEGDAVRATINGAVIVHGLMQTTGGMPASRLAIHGPLVFPGAGGGFDAAFSAEPQVVVDHDPARADVSGFYPTQPRTLAGAQLIHYRADGS